MTYDPNADQGAPQPYGQQNYGQPPYGGAQYGQYQLGGQGQYQYGDTQRYMHAAQNVQTKTNVTAIVSTIMGSVAIAISFTVILWLFSLIIGAIGLILGCVGLSKAKSYRTGRRLAIAGIITNSIGVLGSLFWAVLTFLLFIPLS